MSGIGRAIGSFKTQRRLLAPALIVAMAALAFTAPAHADKIVVVLPGQTLQPGVGLVGTPDPIVLRTPFTVGLFAVDDAYQPLPSYEGRVVIPVVPGTPPVGPPLARRFGTAISALGAATSLPSGGSLRLSLGGGPLQVVPLAPATNPQQVCASIVGGVRSRPVESFAYGRYDFRCLVSASPLGARYTLFLDDGTPVRAVMHARSNTSGGSSILIDPSFGSAAALHLGAPTPSPDPDQAADYMERRPAPPTPADQRFSRGAAIFQTVITSMDAVGSGRTIGVDQGGSTGLPVVTTPVSVMPPSFKINAATALGDGNGRINRIRVSFTEPIAPSSLPVDPSTFTLESPGMPPIAGTSSQLESSDELGYPADSLEITFGSGLGRTDITDVEVRYTPPAGSALVGADTGSSLSATTVNGSVELVDGAPPILLSAFGQDVDGNGGLDRQVFFFSEPVAFSGARGTSVSGFIPATDTTAFSVAVPFELSLRSIGLTTVDRAVTIYDSLNPAATSITGVDAIARAITDCVRWSEPADPAFSHFSASFVSGRYVLRAGIPVRASGRIQVLPPSGPGQGPPSALRLGPANGGVERPGFGDAPVGLSDSLLVVRSQGGANLLLGKTAADMHIAGPTITLGLTNVPSSGTAQPTYVWRDLGDGGFITDLAPAPNETAGFNNAGLPADFHPVTMLRESGSTPAGDGLSLQRTASTGEVILDGSPSVPPLNATGPETVADFFWRQDAGAPIVLESLAPGVARVQPTRAGTYTFTLIVRNSLGLTEPPFNPYTEADGSLARSLVLTVLPGAQMRSVVLLPGTSLAIGAQSPEEVVTGTADVATEGMPYHVRVVTTDAFFNPVPAPPGAQVRLTTTDPADAEPPFRPFVGGQADFTLTPSHAATLAVPEIDDEVIVAFEMGDIRRPYVVGSVWNVRPVASLPGAPGLARFSWTADPRAVRWNIYRTSSLALADLDHDGLPDLGYGTCVPDPDPTDNYFEDATMPPPGNGFLYAGTEVLPASGVLQEAGMGLTSSGLVRPRPGPCP